MLHQCKTRITPALGLWVRILIQARMYARVLYRCIPRYGSFPIERVVANITQVQ